MVTRAGRAGLLGVAALLGVLSSAGAQDAPVESPIKVSVGGVTGPIIRARPRSFAAVRVLLENDSTREVEGTIRVYRSSGSGKATAQQSLFYERRVSLPRGGRRAETVYYYVQENEPGRQLCVSFEPDDGVAPAPVFPELQLHRDQGLVLLLSSHESGEALRIFKSALVTTPRRIHRTEATLAELSALPDHMAGYDPFDAVVVTDLDPADLPPDRARALLDWVSAGGDLIVAYSKRPLPQDLRALLPVMRPGGADRTVEQQLLGLRALSHGHSAPSDERILCDDVQATPESEVLAATPTGAPLVLRGRKGAGWITYLTFPLDAAPLRRWKELHWFSGRLVRMPRSELQGKSDSPMMAPPTEELQLNLSEAIATLTPPSALIIAPLLLLYVALVSPLNYSLLSRRRRLGLAQPIAAGVVVVFGLVFYGLGRIYKGSEDMVTQVAVVDVPPSEGLARIDVVTGYYSTSQALVGAGAPAGAHVGPLAEEATGREGRVLQEPEGVRLDSLTVATWSLRRFRTLRAQDVGAVQANLSLDRSVLRGRVTNGTGLTLEAPLLLLPSGYVELGKPLLPGEAIDLKGSGVTSYLAGNRSDSLELPSLLAGDATNRYPAIYGRDVSVGMHSGDPYGNLGHRRVLGTLQHRLRRIPASHDRIPVLFAARAAADPGGLTLEGTGAPKLARQLVLLETQARLPVPGPILLKDLEPRLDNIPRRDEDWIPVDGVTGAPPQLGGGLTEPAEVVFMWTLPSNDTAPLQADLLRLRWVIGGWQPNLGQSDVEGFDFRRRTWTLLVKQGDSDTEEGFKVWSIPGPNAPPHLVPDDLIDPASGTVLLKFKNHGTDLQLKYLGLDVSGRR